MEVKQLVCQISQNITNPVEQKHGSTLDCRTKASTRRQLEVNYKILIASNLHKNQKFLWDSFVVCSLFHKIYSKDGGSRCPS